MADASTTTNNKTPGYERWPEQRRRRLITEEYEYEFPFHYANVTVHRRFYRGTEFHGVEMNVVNSPNGIEGYSPMAADSIVVEETHPIVRIAVIGSACTPPGYVQIECEVLPEWRQPYELEGVMPIRMRATDLWGGHLRVDQWYSKDEQPHDFNGEPYDPLPEATKERYAFLNEGSQKAHYREFPLTGMSCAIFETPPSRKITVMGGSQPPGWPTDNYPDDQHYSFRTLRTTVRLPDDG